MYHLILKKKLGYDPKNIWHIDKLKLAPEYVSFYYIWTRGRIDTTKYEQAGRITAACKLCKQGPSNIEHVLLLGPAQCLLPIKISSSSSTSTFR
jgi:hypothetical protein